MSLEVYVCMCMCYKGKQRVLRRDSVVRVELAELSAELDLDVISRLGNLSKAFSHCPSQTVGPGLTQVEQNILEHCSKYIQFSPLHEIVHIFWNIKCISYWVLYLYYKPEFLLPQLHYFGCLRYNWSTPYMLENDVDSVHFSFKN